MLPDPFLTLPIAHRTLHDRSAGRPENSIEGAQAGIEAGYGLEIDIQMSKDGQPIVFHDDHLDRLTLESGLVKDLDLVDLRKIPLRYGRATIPSFEEFLDLVSGRVPLLIELKDQDGGLEASPSGLEAAVADLLEPYKGHVALMSFNPHMVARCLDFAPNIPRGLVTDPFEIDDWPDVADERCEQLRSIPDYDRTQSCFISHKRADLGSECVKTIRDKGGQILTWTVYNELQEREARKIAQNVTFEGYLAKFP